MVEEEEEEEDQLFGTWWWWGHGLLDWVSLLLFPPKDLFHPQIFVWGALVCRLNNLYEFSQPPGLNLETCTSFYVLSGPRWRTGRVGNWTPAQSHHRSSTSRR